MRRQKGEKRTIVNGRFTFMAHRPATRYADPVPAPRLSPSAPEHARRPPAFHSFRPSAVRDARRLEYSRSEAQTPLHIPADRNQSSGGDLRARACRAAAIDIRIRIPVRVHDPFAVSACTGIYGDVNEPDQGPGGGRNDGFVYFFKQRCVSSVPSSTAR